LFTRIRVVSCAWLAAAGSGGKNLGVVTLGDLAPACAEASTFLDDQPPNKSGGTQSTRFKAGGIYDFTDHIHFLFSLGRGLQHAKETSEFSWYIGFEVTGGEEPPKAHGCI
jgi:hypothetical protein